jgi:hypothetical protein
MCLHPRLLSECAPLASRPAINDKVNRQINRQQTDHKNQVDRHISRQSHMTRPVLLRKSGKKNTETQCVLSVVGSH